MDCCRNNTASSFREIIPSAQIKTIPLEKLMYFSNGSTD